MARKVTNTRIEEITGAPRRGQTSQSGSSGSSNAAGVLEGGGSGSGPDLSGVGPDIGGDGIPINLRIINQRVYYDALGNQFVDVTFAWDAIEQFDGDYKLRVARP